MAKKVKPEDIIKINKAYKLCGSYSGAAKATGWSAATIKRYVDPNFILEEEPTHNIHIEIPEVSEIVEQLKENKNICALTEEERKAVQNLWEEMII